MLTSVLIVPAHLRHPTACIVFAAVMAVVFVVHAPCAHAGNDPFTVRAWMPDDGLPTSTVLDFTRTPDGYFWVATTGGLARFDGLRFRVFGVADGLPSNRFSSLLVARDGTLWAATDDGWLCRWDGTHFTSHATHLRLGRASMLEERDGGILGASAEIAWRYRDGRTTVLSDRVAAGAVIARDAAGRLWLTSGVQAPARLDGGHLVTLGAATRGLGRWLVDPRTGRAGFFRGAGPGGDAEWLDDRLARVAVLRGAGEYYPQFIDAQGRLWCTTAHDLVALDVRDGREVQRFPLGLHEQAFLARRDADGDFWVCTQTQGLLRVAPSPLRLLRPAGRETPLSVLFAREQRDGTVVVVDEDMRAWRAGAEGLLPSALGRYGAETDGSWEGTRETPMRFTAQAVEVRMPDGRIVRWQLPNFVSCLLAYDPRVPGTVYGVWADQVIRLDAPRGVPRITSLLHCSNEIRNLHVDRAGRLWVATMLGLWRLAPGDTTCFTTRNGLPVDHVRQIHEDTDGTLWFGTYGGGLVRLRGGHFATLDRRQGLLEDVVSVVLEDDDGHLWLAGNHGIQRLSKRQANDCLDGRRPRVDVVGFGRESGLRNPEGSGLPGLRARDGRLLFPTFDGLAVIDPALARALAGSPPVPHVEAVSADGRELELRGGGFVVPAGTARFELRYTALEPRAAEQLRFAYRLDGVDRDWVEAGGGRTATYTNVPPGRHVFRLRATSGAGVASAHDAEAVLDVRPHLWQTPLFALLVIVSLVLAASWALRERERQLRARATELQAAVHQRTAELAHEKHLTEDALATVEAQAQRLAALDRARSRFFASISHEFRTPLTLIHGPLHDLRTGQNGPLRADAEAQVDVALDNAGRLHRLVDQLLDAARAEAGELRIDASPGDLTGFLARVADALAPLAERKRIRFERPAGEPLRVAFDAAALEKVFANLLGNAFKFTPAGGRVELAAARVHDAAGEWAEVTVRDDGPGIAPEDLPHVFKRFYRAEHSITRMQPGTGLGLALAWDLVEQHGGAIRAESREGLGSTFVVRLPLLPAADVAAPEGAAAAALTVRADLLALTDEIRIEDAPGAGPAGPEAFSPDPEAPLVLVVDDHEQVRRYIAGHLGRDWRVREAADGLTALAAMRQEAPDLVVSDVGMPGMDGYALVAAIRADAELDFVPVLLLTAAASEASRIAGLEGGADDYITKPFSMRELRARVARALDSRRRLRDRVARSAAEAAVYGADMPAIPTARPASPAASRAAVDRALVRRLREVIESRMGEEDFDVDRLAEAMGMGRTLLFQKVGELLDETPMALVLSHRLERAAQMLRAGEGNVGEVAYAVGFRSVSHFTRRFRERFGRTPGEWRRGGSPPGA